MVHRIILQPMIDGMRKDKIQFVEILFTGLVVTKDGPEVLEYNVRFGDLKMQTMLQLMDADMAEVMAACTDRYPDATNLKANDLFACTVVACAGGYPGPYVRGDKVILDNPPPDTYIFHAGTKASTAARAWIEESTSPRSLSIIVITLTYLKGSFRLITCSLLEVALSPQYLQARPSKMPYHKFIREYLPSSLPIYTIEWQRINVNTPFDARTYHIYQTYISYLLHVHTPQNKFSGIHKRLSCTEFPVKFQLRSSPLSPIYAPQYYRIPLRSTLAIVVAVREVVISTLTITAAALSLLLATLRPQVKSKPNLVISSLIRRLPCATIYLDLQH